jgi:branched-chain amino acid transport system ATP-binding protein
MRTSSTPTWAARRMSLLSIEGLHAAHGLLPAVRGVGFELDAGETLALVGANGAGKSTLLRTIAGVHRAAAGRIVYEGRDLAGVPAHARVAAGIALVPEGRRLFPAMTVEENLRVGATAGREGEWTLARVRAAFPQLERIWRTRALHLSGGEQQATAIGRALMANPRLLLLDEVSLGLSPKAVDGVYESLRRVLDSGTTVILVEQDLNRCLAVAGRVACMLEGRIVATGLAGQMTRAQVMAHYFGERRGAAAEAA